MKYLEKMSQVEMVYVSNEIVSQNSIFNLLGMQFINNAPIILCSK